MTEEKNEKIVTGKEGEVKKFSELYRGVSFEGKRVEIDEILSKPLVLIDFAEMQGQFGTFAVCQAKLNGEMITFPIGSEVILAQIRKIKLDGNFPILTMIQKRISEKTKRTYYTLC